MCGIGGIYAFHPAARPPDRGELLRIRESMARRGPDGAGEWWSENRRCGLAHRRLSIIDLSDRALQPMSSPDGAVSIVFNGEIYNYAELRAELEAQGVEHRTTSDTETLLHLYRRDGAAMVSRLRGMFAFALWDDQRHGLLLARDPYGIKPLYTATDGWTFRFASQVKALIAGGGVSRDAEPAGLVGFHLFGHVPEPFTIFRDVHALPAGHVQWIDPAGPGEPVPYADLGQVLAHAGPAPVDTEEQRQVAKAALLDSVRAHLVADVEVGAFLSAGVDSGALLGLMTDAGQAGVLAITLGFDQFHGSPYDEAPLAAQLASAYGARHVVRRISKAEFDDDLPAILDAMDQPSIDGVNTWFVSKAAREAGLKVAVSGVGGDELLAGYPSFRDLPRWRRVGRIGALPGAGALARAMLSTFAPFVVRARPKVLGLLDYAGSWEGAYLLRRGLFLPRELERIIEPELAREGLRRLAPLKLVKSSLHIDPGSDVSRVCVLESANYLRNQLLRDADWAGMAHGLEIRTPLVDIALLRAMAPVVRCLKPGEGKALLATAPSRPLPSAVLHRAKTGFAVPTAQWMERPDLDRGAVPTNALVSRSWSQVVLSEAVQHRGLAA
jgi:asparagine synthase (glutamine-hydrolysing)